MIIHPRQWKYLLLLPVAVLLIGTVGFMLLEKLSFMDSLYFTFVTISTVGYGDITPVTEGGRGFAIFIILIGITSFLTILTSLAQTMIHQGQERLHRHRLNMLIGVFFTETGNELLRIFSRFDPHVNTVRRDMVITPEWTTEEFNSLKRHLSGYHYDVDAELLELGVVKEFLKEKGDMLLRQLENDDLARNEDYAELLWAIVHLRDELLARRRLDDLPETDLAHIVVDIKRAYSLLTRQWLDYMQYLKNRYPFLFSLALRTNPFVESASAIVT
jgi:voltage-gated potassium channel